MKFFLSVLLVVLLPVQSSWAVVASYCGHSSKVITSSIASDSTHLCHHAHGSKPSQLVIDISLSPAAQSQNLDQAQTSDCASCHNTCCSVVFIALPLSLASVNFDHVASRLTVRYPTIRAAEIERPVWQSPT
jgi:hypothetical protein